MPGVLLGPLVGLTSIPWLGAFARFLEVFKQFPISDEPLRQTRAAPGGRRDAPREPPGEK